MHVRCKKQKELEGNFTSTSEEMTPWMDGWSTHSKVILKWDEERCELFWTKIGETNVDTLTTALNNMKDNPTQQSIDQLRDNPC